MLNQETIIKLAVQHGFKVGRDAGGEYVAPKYEDAVGSLVALVQAAYALGQQAPAVAGAVPDGYALVPRNLQPEQRAAILAWARENSQSNSWPEKAYEIAIAAAPMLAAAPQAASESSMQWPQERDVGRIGDMSKVASLRVGLDADSDVYVCIHGEAGSGSVEFCVPGSGGGKSPRTRAALISLMVAMEADNAETPSRNWWAAREAAAKKGGE